MGLVKSKLFKSNKSSRRSSEPIITAIFQKNEAELCRLIGLNSNLAQNLDSTMLLHHAIGNDINPMIIRMMLDYGVDANGMTAHNCFVLYPAVCDNKLDIVRLLVEYGADVNARTKRQQPALNYAVGANLPDMVRLLVELGADVNLTSDAHWNGALYQAVEHNRPNMVRLLIELGADINAEPNYYSSPLYCAVNRGDANMVRLLVGYCADIRVEPYTILRLIHRATIDGNVNVVDQLATFEHCPEFEQHLASEQHLVPKRHHVSDVPSANLPSARIAMNVHRLLDHYDIEERRLASINRLILI